MRDLETQVLQVGVAIANKNIEHEPAKEPGAGHRRAAAGIRQGREALHAAFAVFEASIQPQ